MQKYKKIYIFCFYFYKVERAWRSTFRFNFIILEKLT
jgi:hypothetical protein